MKRISVGNTVLHVVDEGRGLPLLLVHGFPLDHTMWRHQLATLSSTSRVIAPDLRGFGQSDVTPGKVTMDGFADDLAALLDKLGLDEPVVLCGLSMGGYIAWQFWRRHGARLRGLVLCDTRAAADTPEAARAREATAQRVVAEGPQVVADAMLPKLLSAQVAERQPQLAAQVRETILKNDPQGIVAALRGMAERPDVTGWLPSIDVPTLVLVGADDSISTPSEMRAIAAAIPAAEFVEVPDAGHLAPLENPEAVNEALRRFLGRLQAT